MRTEHLRGIAGRNGQRIARCNKGSAGQTAHHLGAACLPATQLFAHGFDIFDGHSQVSAQSNNRFQHIHDKAENEQNQNTTYDESQILPPSLLWIFRAVIERAFCACSDAGFGAAQILARSADHLRIQFAARFQAGENLIRFIQMRFRFQIDGEQ